MTPEVETKKTGDKVERKITIDPALVGASFKSFHEQATEALTLCEQIAQVTDDDENTAAREIGQQANKIVKAINSARLALNKPLKETTDKNNASAKALTDPIGEHLDRIKTMVGKYETRKEAIRQEALRKAEEERIAKEEEARKEAERIASIRQSINTFQIEWSQKINECKTIKTLDKYEGEIKGVKATKKEYGGQVGLMKEAIRASLALIKERRPTVSELEKASGIVKEEMVADDKVQQSDRAHEMTMEQQQNEMIAEQELITLLASLKSPDVKWTVEQKIKELKDRYGSAVEAVKHRDAIIETEQDSIASTQEVKQLKGDKVKNQRKELKFRIADPNKIPREYLKVDEAKIRQVVMENRVALKADLKAFSIDGVEIYIDTQTVLG